MRELGGGKKSNIPRIMSPIPLEKERGIHQGFQRREAVEGRMEREGWGGLCWERWAKELPAPRIQKGLGKGREGTQRSNSQRKIPVSAE